MNKEAKPVIIMSDTDYAKLVDTLMNNPVSESLGVIMDCIKVVADAKTEKRFWKARRVCISTIGPIPGATECYTDTMELTLDEAKYWYKDWAKHLNDARGDKVFYGAIGLFYKEGNEWIRYMVEEEYELGRIL